MRSVQCPNCQATMSQSEVSYQSFLSILFYSVSLQFEDHQLKDCPVLHCTVCDKKVVVLGDYPGESPYVILLPLGI